MSVKVSEPVAFAKPYLGPEEAEAAKAVVESGWVMQGPKVAEFERVFAEYCQTREAVAVSNCTTALHLALVVLGVGPGDEVICPSMSFIATANAIAYTGATPVFVDVDPLTFNLDPDAAEAAITPRTKVIMPVHQLGLPVDIDRFSALGRKHDLAILEDAACAIGSRYKGRPVGGHSEMACFSFHPRKVITTGEGGMITTNNAAYAERLRLLRQHGMNASVADRHNARQVVIEDYVCLGYNYRMTDIQAAIGIEQMKKLDGMVARRRELAARYAAALADHPWLRAPHVPDYAEPTFQSYAVTLTDQAPMTRNQLMQYLLDRGVASRRGVMLAHAEPAYASRGRRTDLSASEHASAISLLLPLYPQMPHEVQDIVTATLFEAAGLATSTAGTPRPSVSPRRSECQWTT
jgi:dTDP-4-amino-4,6-dideoxygalactose transaminase